MERVALRWWLSIIAVVVVAPCLATFRAPEPQASIDGWGLQTPPPPAQAFVFVALATPAILVAGPLLIANEWLAGSAVVRLSLLLLSTGLFWFAVAYRMDAARGRIGEAKSEPKWIRVYLFVFRCISPVIALLILLGIVISSAHADEPPLWSQLAGAGIVFTWCFIGALPVLKHLRKPVGSAYKVVTHSADE